MTVPRKSVESDAGSLTNTANRRFASATIASSPKLPSTPMSRADRSAGTLPHADSSTADALQDRHSAGGPAIFVSPGSGSRSGPFPLVTGLPAAPAVLAALQLGQPKSQPTDQLDPRPARHAALNGKGPQSPHCSPLKPHLNSGNTLTAALPTQAITAADIRVGGGDEVI